MGPVLEVFAPPFRRDTSSAPDSTANQPLLARLADATTHRWRFGFIALSPIIVAGLALVLVGQARPGDPGVIEAESRGSALQPLIAGVAGVSSRSGAATPEAGNGAHSPTSFPPASYPPTSTAKWAVAQPSDREDPAPDPAGPGRQRPAATTTTTEAEGAALSEETTTTAVSSPPVETTAVEGSSTTEPPVTETETDVDTETTRCVIDISRKNKKLRAGPSRRAEVLLGLKPGTYVVLDTSAGGSADWYLIDVDGTNGWIRARGAEQGSYHCN